MTRSLLGTGRPSLLLAVVCLAACPARNNAVDAGEPPGAFFAPSGIAATSRYVLVVSSAFHFEEGRPTYARGWLTAIDRRSRRVVGQVPTSGINPQYLAVFGERALVVSSGRLRIDSSGLGSAAGDGALDLFDFSSGVPLRPAASLLLPRSGADPRIGGYGAITLSGDGRRAFIGSATRGDLFVVDLDGLRLRRGADNPVVVFPTPPGKNGLTTPGWLGTQLAVLDFNSDSMCMISDPGGELDQRRCQNVGGYPDLLEGPLDLAVGPGGELLVLMGLANGLYRVDPRSQPFAVAPGFAKTGLAPNRVLVHEGYAYIVNSLSANLQRVELSSRHSDLPFAVLPVASDPYDMCITKEPEGVRGWVTLNQSNQVAVIDLSSGKLLELLPGKLAIDARAGDYRLSDAGQRDTLLCNDAGSAVVGISNVVELKLGPGGGSGQEKLPAIIQGAPAGEGNTDDLLSLGTGGQIVVDFGEYDIVDGPGPDFLVFENPFLLGPYQPFAEPAVVGVAGGTDTGPPTSFVEFPCNLSVSQGDPSSKSWPYPGCAGVHPVQAGKSNCISPSDPAKAGGDAFDLATLGLARTRYLRLRDAGISTMGETTKGFDLDAVVLIHYTKR